MKNYINLIQGKVARFDAENPPNGISGFFTNCLASNGIIILSGINNGYRRISVIHFDDYIFNNNPRIFNDEHEWVGEKASCDIFLRPHWDKNNIASFFNYVREKKIILEFFNTIPEITEFAINFGYSFRNNFCSGFVNKMRGYCVALYKTGAFNENISSHSSSEKIHVYYMLNLLLNKVESNAKLRTALINKNYQEQKIPCIDSLLPILVYKLTAEYTVKSNFNPSSLLFDGKNFVSPTGDDLKFTEFSSDFLQKIDALFFSKDGNVIKKLKEFKANIETLIQDQSLTVNLPIRDLQFIIMAIIKVYTDIDIYEPDTLVSIINQSSAIADSYLAMKNIFHMQLPQHMQDGQIFDQLTRFESMLFRSTESLNVDQTSDLPNDNYTSMKR